MNQKEQNHRFAENLRELADFYAKHADKPWLRPPYHERLLICLGADMFRQAIRDVGACKKEVDGDYAAATVTFGPMEVYIFTDRDKVCRKIQTGTKFVPETTVEAVEAKVIPAHEEPVYKWDCSPFLAGSKEEETDEREEGDESPAEVEAPASA